MFQRIRLSVLLLAFCAIGSLPALADDLLPLDKVARIVVPSPDVPKLLEQDAADEAEGLKPYRFAVANHVEVTPMADGTWERLDDQVTMLWRLRVLSVGALHINLGFTQYRLPAGAELRLLTIDGRQTFRSFTSTDNAAHGQLWTPLVPGEEIVVELRVPETLTGDVVLELGSINVGYKPFGPIGRPPEDGSPRSGSCNRDVVCPEGIPWQDQIPGVCALTKNGVDTCSAFMVNNTAQDHRAYVQTAYHCGVTESTAPTVVVYWNYQNSWCRPLGSPESGAPGDGSLAQFTSGATFRAGWATSDFTLMEMSSLPDPEWNITWLGWDRRGLNPPSGACIHHPAVEEKRITFYDVADRPDRPSHGSSWGCSAYPGPGDNTHIKVYWKLEGAVTEPGSSGSPLFDENHRVIGQLHGGLSACGATGDSLSDCYGRVSVSWTGGGTSSTRLSDWLDAGNTGALNLDTIGFCSEAGTVRFDRPKFACEDSAAVRISDCGLNLNPDVIETVTINVSSTSEPAGESLVLTETSTASAMFEGWINVSGTNDVGVLLVAAGDTITATYNDADHGSGTPEVVTAQAVIDCTGPTIANIQAIDLQPRSVTVAFDCDEEAQGTVHYGPSCDDLSQTVNGTGFAFSPAVSVTGLQDNTTYYYRVDAVDQAGNLTQDTNCQSFTTTGVPDFFTEFFEGSDNDLDNLSLLFVPNGSVDFYAGCEFPITELPTDPAGGTALTLTDDSYATVNLTGGATVKLYGVEYGTLYVGSNGYITFNSGDTDWSETLADHFDLPRVSALFNDMDPAQAGTVSWKQLSDRLAVTWLDVTVHNGSNQNTFQIELFFDGRIAVNYLAIAAADGLAGLSQGQGLPADYFESDLSGMGSCGPRPPGASGANLSTAVGVPLDITLNATDDGLPDPPAILTYILTALPAAGNTLVDLGNGHVILPAELPYTLVNHGNRVRYTPAPAYSGADTFQFKANDGGMPPEGGDSNTATVSISVQWGPPEITTTWLPDGYLSVPYGPVQMQVSQGTPPRTWSLVTTGGFVEADLGNSQFANVGTARNWRDDDRSWSYALPFAFPFYGTNYTSVWVCTNGFLDFTSSAAPYDNSTAGLIAAHRIAPMWDDLETYSAGMDIFTDITVPDQVTIRWKAQTVPLVGNPKPVNFSVTLYADGRIRFHYGSGNTGLTPTIGVSSGNGTVYTLSTYNNAATLTNANSHEFTVPPEFPPGMTLDPSGLISGTPTMFGTFGPTFKVVDAENRSDLLLLPLVIHESSQPDPINCDNVPGFDFPVEVGCFVHALLGAEDYPGSISRCDLNHDGVTNGLDITPWVDCVVNNQCP